MIRKNLILPVIVISQFCCTSLWFAGNGVMGDLLANFNLNDSALAHLTSAIQLGFIIGTLTFAILTIADRYSPSKVFFVSAILGSLFNLLIVLEGNTITSLLSLRFLTGFFLAGIYPIGMKIAADHYKKGLGKSLGFLVGALVVGTAFPHLLKGIGNDIQWKSVLFATSGLAVSGGLLMMSLVPNGPYRRAGQGVDFSAFFNVFKNRDFRTAAFGYFGHMWELYAFWAFVPVMLQTYNDLYSNLTFNISTLSFLIIGVGGLSCVFGGYLSQKLGVKRVAFVSLLISCVCCLISPFIFNIESELIFLGLLFIWGMSVIADSPLFSTLVAHKAEPEIKGTALTIVNCIGFSITIISIQLLNGLRAMTDSNSIYIILALGPILGLIALSQRSNRKELIS